MSESAQRAALPAPPMLAALPAPRGKVIVLGIGNSLLADDGVGVHAVRWLHEQVPEPDIEWLDAGTLNFTLLHYLDGARALLVIDAADLGEKPGTVRAFFGDEMDRVVTAGRRNSVHEAGLADLLGIARLKDCLPEHRALITVQPQRIGWGDALSAPVAGALPGVCEQARLLALRWAE